MVSGIFYANYLTVKHSLPMTAQPFLFKNALQSPIIMMSQEPVGRRTANEK